MEIGMCANRLNVLNSVETRGQNGKNVETSQWVFYCMFEMVLLIIYKSPFP